MTTPQSNLVWYHTLLNVTTLYGQGKSAELKNGGSVTVQMPVTPKIVIVLD